MQASSEHDQIASQLLDYVQKLERNYYDWRAVHLHLSRLKAHNRRDYQLRVAASEFDDLLRRFSSELFQLDNGDIFFLWHGGSVDDVDAIVLRLRYLFSDDPLTNSDIAVHDDDAEVDELGDPLDMAKTPQSLCTWFDLEREYTSFAFHVEEYLESLKGGVQTETAPEDAPLEPGRLGQIEASLSAMDLSGLARRQQVCAVLPQSAPKPLFAEIYVAMRDLAQAVVPGVNLTADTWLFQRLAETIDRRLLAALANQDLGASKGAISINLRLATLLSPEFLKFDHEYRSANKAQVIIELQLIDIFAELGAYLFIREFVKDRGYLVCIDGLHYLHLPMIDRKRLGADMVKVIWSPDLLGGLSESQLTELKSTIKRIGVDRVILCRCDTADAIRWGQSLGVRLFQGHYVDSRLRAARPPAVAAARKAMRATS